MAVYIYTLKHPLTEEIRYVGKTNSPKRRYKEHIYKLDKNDHKTNWIKSLLAEGLKPVMSIIEECADNWEEREKYWITQFDNLINLTDGGEGYTMSEEVKEKIRKAHIGKKLSNKTKDKLRQINMGANNPMFGKTKLFTDETKMKMSLAKKGKTLNTSHVENLKKSSHKKPCIIDGQYYDSVNDASRILNIPKGTISTRISNKNKPNYIWWNEKIVLSLHSQDNDKTT